MRCQEAKEAEEIFSATNMIIYLKDHKYFILNPKEGTKMPYSEAILLTF